MKQKLVSRELQLEGSLRLRYTMIIHETEGITNELYQTLLMDFKCDSSWMIVEL